MPIQKLMVLGTAALLSLAAGCARWSTPAPEGEPGGLPWPKLGPRSVVLELMFVRIPEEQTDFSDRFWPEVDETALSTAQRRRLATNGFRCGLIGSTLPAVLREIVDQQVPGEVEAGVKLTDPNGQPTVRTHRLRSHPGQKGKIMVNNAPVEQLAALFHDEEGRVTGETFTKAQLYYSVMSFDQGNGQVQLELAPMLEHGDPKPGYKGVNGSWTMDNTSRDARMFENMKIETKLAPGEAVAITSTSTPRGLGQQFFGGNPVERTSRLLLVVRLQQTQSDNRFSEDPAFEPVASTVD
ncbi:MAG: hypothetical protein R6U98_10430 [Pirellulaceae bacterium]